MAHNRHNLAASLPNLPSSMDSTLTKLRKPTTPSHPTPDLSQASSSDKPKTSATRSCLFFRRVQNQANQQSPGAAQNQSNQRTAGYRFFRFSRVFPVQSPSQLFMLSGPDKGLVPVKSIEPKDLTQF